MKQTLPKIFVWLLVLINVVLTTSAIMSKSEEYALMVLAIVFTGGSVMFIFNFVDFFISQKFNSLRDELEGKGFKFLGPKKATSYPGGPKAKIEDQRFCMEFKEYRDEIKCFRAKGSVIVAYGVSYRHLLGPKNVEYVIVYDQVSKQFGLFKKS